MIIKIAFVGESCAGKSTAYDFAADALRSKSFAVRRVDVATPLHIIQRAAYKALGITAKQDAQDTRLLTFLAENYEQPMLTQFQRSFDELFSLKKPKDDPLKEANRRAHAMILEKLTAPRNQTDQTTIDTTIDTLPFLETDLRCAVINTDCRANAYSVLKRLGFKFIRIQVDPDILYKRHQLRSDVGGYQSAKRIPIIESGDYIISNNDSLNDFRENVRNAIRSIVQL